MAMNRYGYLDYKKLEVGDQVSWEHPVTGKVYDFEVTELDLKDEYQPVELRLLDEVGYCEIVNVSEYAEFGHKGTRSWVYKSLAAHKDRYGYEPDPNSITLDRLFYTSSFNEPKADNAPILDIEGPAAEGLIETIRKGRTFDNLNSGNLQIPSAEEVNQYRYTSQADFQKVFVEQMAKAIKLDEDHIKLPPVLVEMYKEELINLGYWVHFDTVYFAKFD